MRSMIVLPLAAAFVLAGCGSSGADADGDGKITTAEAAAETQKATGFVGPRPGQYRIKTEILELDVPGMPAGMSVEMMNKMAGGMDITYCITEQDAAKAAREMAGQTNQGECEFQKYEITGGRIDTAMTCKGADGKATTIKTNGTIDADGMDITAEIDTPGMKQKAHVVHERVGDCTG